MNARQAHAMAAAVSRAIYGADCGETPEQAARAAGQAFTDAGGDWLGADPHDIRSFRGDFAYHGPMNMAMEEYYRRNGVPEFSSAFLSLVEMTRTSRRWSDAFCAAWPIERPPA